MQAIVKYDFKAEENGELSVNKGDIVSLMNDMNVDGWILVQNQSMSSGYVPYNYLTISETILPKSTSIQPLTQPDHDLTIQTSSMSKLFNQNHEKSYQNQPLTMGSISSSLSLTDIAEQPLTTISSANKFAFPESSFNSTMNSQAKWSPIQPNMSSQYDDSTHTQTNRNQAIIHQSPLRNDLNPSISDEYSHVNGATTSSQLMSDNNDHNMNIGLSTTASQHQQISLTSQYSNGSSEGENISKYMNTTDEDSHANERFIDDLIHQQNELFLSIHSNINTVDQLINEAYQDSNHLSSILLQNYQQTMIDDDSLSNDDLS